MANETERVFLQWEFYYKNYTQILHKYGKTLNFGIFPYFNNTGFYKNDTTNAYLTQTKQFDTINSFLNESRTIRSDLEWKIISNRPSFNFFDYHSSKNLNYHKMTF